MQENDVVLRVKDLSISFNTFAGRVNAIRGVDFELRRGETVAIVGESGSGKSVTVKSILGIRSKNEIVDRGEILFTYRAENGEDRTENLLKLSDRDMQKRIRGRHIALVFQDPLTSLNPTMTIGAQIAERSSDERPDFVIGLSDVLASGVISALIDKGISVPEQVRVAGCDGNPLAWSGSVPLTTVAPPGYEIGRKGVQLLMEQIENKPIAKAKRVRIGSAARTVTAGTATEDINRQELVRPFLLERASTQASTQTDATAINLGAYL